MKSGIFYGVVKEGKVHLDSKTVWDAWLKTQEGNRVQIEVSKEAEHSTDNQFRYLYGCIYTPLAEYTGYTVEEIDGFLKKKHLTVKVKKKKGKVLEYIKDKRNLTKKELAKYIDDCIQTCAECGVTVLPPDRFKG